MRSIIIDTSFWLLPFERKVDIFEQMERLLEEPFVAVVPAPVLSELGAMARGVGRRAIAARGALSLIEKKKGKWLEIDPQRGAADGVIITVALQRGAIVATTDSGLRRRLNGKKVNCITLRDLHKVDFA